MRPFDNPDKSPRRARLKSSLFANARLVEESPKGGSFDVLSGKLSVHYEGSSLSPLDMTALLG